ncbi:hypothetical protein ABT391_08365 [Streptomyces jumonjinensis]|uniref:hypothetical protein n=1 Tax=Streptomyces jumonjinensis TaxID=1945 RepID=UPI00332D1962
MSTTRHLINRRRRQASALRAREGAPATAPGPDAGPESDAGSPKADPDAGNPEAEPDEPVPEEASPPSSPRRHALSVALSLLPALVLGAFAVVAGGESAALGDEPAVRNAALSDVARTSELKGRIAKAVESVFSYDFAAPARLDRAVSEHLTGGAVAAHRRMLAAVREAGPRQKLVLTTTVTHSGVEHVDGERARVLLFADQSSTRTAGEKDGTTHAGAMLAVDAVHDEHGWRITAIDTFGAGS